MKFCSNCGQPVEGNVKFCSNCGAKLMETPAAAPVETPAAAPAETFTEAPVGAFSEAPAEAANGENRYFWGAQEPAAMPAVETVREPWEAPEPEKKRKTWWWIVGAVCVAAVALLVAVFFMVNRVPKTPQDRLKLALSRTVGDLRELCSVTLAPRPENIGTTKVEIEVEADDEKVVSVEGLVNLEDHAVSGSIAAGESVPIDIDLSFKETELRFKSTELGEDNVFVLDLAKYSPEIAEKLWKTAEKDVDLWETLGITEAEIVKDGVELYKYSFDLMKSGILDAAKTIDSEMEIPPVIVSILTDRKCNLRSFAVEVEDSIMELRLDTESGSNPWGSFLVEVDGDKYPCAIQRQDGVTTLKLYEGLSSAPAAQLTWDDAKGRLTLDFDGGTILFEIHTSSKGETNLYFMADDNEMKLTFSAKSEPTDETIVQLEGEEVDFGELIGLPVD